MTEFEQAVVGAKPSLACQHGQLARSCEICDLIRERDAALAGLDATQQALREEMSERDILRALLREVEWANAGRCLFCRRLGTVNNEQEPYGHTPDCRLKAALEGRDG